MYDNHCHCMPLTSHDPKNMNRKGFDAHYDYYFGFVFII